VWQTVAKVLKERGGDQLKRWAAKIGGLMDSATRNSARRKVKRSIRGGGEKVYDEAFG